MLASNSLFSTSMLLLWVSKFYQLAVLPTIYSATNRQYPVREKSTTQKSLVHSFFSFPKASMEFSEFTYIIELAHPWDLSNLPKVLSCLYKKKKVLEASGNEENVPQNFGILSKLLCCKGQKNYSCFGFPSRLHQL